MEDWSYFSEEKGPNFVEEMDLHIDGFPRNTKLSIGFDQKTFYTFDQNVLISDREAIESMETPLYGCNSTHEIPAFQEDESGSSISNPFIEFNARNASLIDLKLGRATEFPRTQSNDEIEEKVSVNSVVSTALLGKRATTRITRPVCQVYGCNKDLSSLKNYHTRHRVCDVHSKMAKVIVDGLEQRFCQQCSRFHLLSEFDGEKRSCRRRLAGHNERRRKSHLLGRTRKSPRLLQSSQGYTGTSAKKPTILSPDLFPCHTLHAKAAQSLTPHGFTTCKPFLEAQGNHKRYGSDDPTSGKAPVFQELSGVSLSSSSSLSSGGASSRALSLLSTKSREFCQLHASNQNISQMHRLYGMRHTGLAPDMMLFQAPELLNMNTCLSTEQESTVDLFQLSSHLRRIEQQRNSFHVHNDNAKPDYYPGLI